MHFVILFDNYTKKAGLLPLWGFSCYIPELRLLFDTGSNGRVLLQNAKEMGVDLTQARYLFISHPHWDHIGGLDSVLEINPHLTLFVPETLSKHLIKDLEQFAKEVVVVSREPMRLFDGCYSIGVMGDLEHSFVIQTDTGVNVVTGCSHPGIVAIAQRAQRMSGQNIHYLLGGFYLFQKSDKEIEAIAKELLQMGVECVTPTHCSGERAMEIFAQYFGRGYKQGGVGEVIVC